jgi:hypothetical protein
MRTKALLGLAALAVGLSTSVAQNVYSLNVVGYVNVSLQANKLHFLSLPVVPVDGNFNITNTIVLDNSQDFANIYTWAGTGWSTTTPTWFGTDLGGTGWAPSMVISNGVGFFLASAANSTLTFVGQVPQGALAYNIPAGLSTLANQVPVSANFPGATVGNDFDNIYTWDLTGQGWSTVSWTYFGADLGGTGWSNGGGAGNNAAGPLLNPGDGVFYVNGGAALPFTQNFTVN